MIQTSPTLARLYRSIPFSAACDLHQRLRAGEITPKTQYLLRLALVRAGLKRAD